MSPPTIEERIAEARREERRRGARFFLFLWVLMNLGMIATYCAGRGWL